MLSGSWLLRGERRHKRAILRRRRMLVEGLESRTVLATLALEIAADFIREGDGAAATTATLTRTGDLSQPLTVNLTSSDTSEVAVPESVTFAAGQGALEFDVAAVDDAVLDGTQTATITATAQIVSGTPVGLDASFGASGLAPVRLIMVIQAPNAAMAIQPDGKIVAAGENGSGSSWRVTRVHPNGQLDTSFGSFGLVDTYPSPFSGGSYPVPHKVLVQGDGKILVGGKFAGGFGSAALVRYNSTGALDTTFGNAGRADLANAGGWIEDIALRSDGRMILVIAFNGSTNFRLVGLTPNGTFDPTFSFKNYTGIGGLARSIEMLDDGRFVVAGSNKVVRFLADGTLDASFGAGGVQTLTWGSSGSQITELGIDAAGRVVVGGHTFLSNTDNSNNMAVARLDADGNLDETFSGDGKLIVDFAGFDDLTHSMLLQPDGKVLLGGFAEVSSGVFRSALARVGTDGSLDATFDGDGLLAQDLIPSSAERFYDMAFTSAGQLVALTGFANDFRLARLHLGQEVTDLLASDAVSVLDDENAPPAIEDQLFEIAENSAAETAIGQVLATDPDAGQTLLYEIAAGNELGALAIDPASGALRVADPAALDFETNPSLSITVRVTDDGSPHLSDEAIVTVALTDVNEAPALADASFNLAENSPAGTFVGTVTAADPDAGQSHQYAIVSGNDSGAFAIDGSGQITVANAGALDFEATPVFTLTVQATDNGSPPLQGDAQITIRLTDVVERLEVGIDVKPNDPGNEIVLKRDKKVQVAILSTADFDAVGVDLNSLRIGRTGTEDSIVRDKKGRVVYSLSDVNGDGRLDLVVSFHVVESGLQAGDTQVHLTGRLLSGLDLFASDDVTVRSQGNRKSGNDSPRELAE